MELHEALKAADRTSRDVQTYDTVRRAIGTWWEKSIEATKTAKAETARMRAMRQMADGASKHGAVEGAIGEWMHASREEAKRAAAMELHRSLEAAEKKIKDEQRRKDAWDLKFTHPRKLQSYTPSGQRTYRTARNPEDPERIYWDVFID
jgi:hypothetical protein